MQGFRSPGSLQRSALGIRSHRLRAMTEWNAATKAS